MSITKIRVNCYNCGIEVEKVKAEYNRSKRLGRRFFCGHACSVTTRNKEYPKEKRRQESKHLKPDNRRDKYTPFRFFTHVIRNSRKNKEFNIDNEYLKSLWEKQKGICPFTGWKLILPHNTNGWENGLTIHSASLDRIDNSKEYVEGNVRFVSVMANFVINKFTGEDMIEFCKAVVDNNGVNNEK